MAEYERRSDIEDKGDPLDSKYWLQELDAAHKREKNWRENIAPEIEKEYRDQRTKLDVRADKKFNILWSNTEVLKSALYPDSAQPDVRRRFGTADKVARQGATVLERALSYCSEEYDLDGVVRQALEDSLLPGRGQAWVVYEPTITVKEGEGDGEDPAEEITAQELCVEYVHWQDYREGSCRSWRSMPWVARRHLYTPDEFEKGFEDHAGKVPAGFTTAGSQYGGRNNSDEQSEVFDRIEVWEIWDKTRKERVYVVEGYDRILRADKDPYGLEDFFPCPEPLRKVTSNKDRVPVPEPSLYWDQIEELDRVTTRIVKLINVLKWRGVYDATNEDADATLANLPDADDNQFFPAKNFVQLMEKGGLKQALQSVELSDIVTTLQGLYQQRREIIDSIYQLTGISDIIRGSTDPNETKGAQQLKAQFGSMRMQHAQKEVQRFVRDIMRIESEIIAEHFEIDILAEMTGVEMPREADVQAEMMQFQQQAEQIKQQAAMRAEQTLASGQQLPEGAQQMAQQAMGEYQAKMEEFQSTVTWEKVKALLASDKARGYKIDVETDQTAFQDAEAEKTARMEFMDVVTRMFAETIPAMQAFPASIPLVKEAVMFVVRGFKVGRPIEEAIEDAFDDIAKQPPKQEADPKAEAAQAQMQMKMQEMEMRMKQMASEFQLKQQAAQSEIQLDREKTQADIAMEQTKANAGIAMQQAELEADQRRKDTELQADLEREAVKAAADMDLAQRKAETAQANSMERGNSP